MTPKEMLKLLPMTIVKSAAKGLGTVILVGYTGIFVNWENGKRTLETFENNDLELA